MVSETQNFWHSGPSYLNYVDWNCPSHRRCVMASLVRGVHVLERDRQLKLSGPKSLARPWWEFFHFQLNDVLVDSAHCSVFGAIFELKMPSTYPQNSALNAPKYVIAFRGTMTKPDTIFRDLFLDFLCLINRLHQSSIFQHTMHAIQNTIALAGTANVCLAGHSLGSAIALLAGKKLAKMGCALPAYLFNSPFPSAFLERISPQEIKQEVHIVSSALKVGLAAALKVHQQDDPFAVLSSWVPYLFVNPSDHICLGYIRYFENRENMEKIGAGKLDKRATKLTGKSLLSSALDRNSESEPFHLLPSAELIINQGQTSRTAAHGIKQWWDPNLIFQSLIYRYK